MLLVFFFIIIVLIIIISTLRAKLFIQINNNVNKYYIKIYLFGKIKIAKINLDKIRKNRNSKKDKNGKNKQAKIKQRKIIKIIYKITKKITIKLEKLDLNIDICTTDAIATSYLVAGINNAITFLLKKSNLKINYTNCKYKVNPIFVKEKITNIKLKCIFSANLVHIIYIILKNVKEWRCDIYGRTASNRRSYGNSNEQHKAND